MSHDELKYLEIHGNRYYKRLIDDDASFFGGLHHADYYCLECDYGDPLELQKQGYICPSCGTVVIPRE